MRVLPGRIIQTVMIKKAGRTGKARTGKLVRVMKETEAGTGERSQAGLGKRTRGNTRQRAAVWAIVPSVGPQG